MYTDGTPRTTIIPAAPVWNVLEPLVTPDGTLRSFARHPILAWHLKEGPMPAGAKTYDMPHVVREPIVFGLLGSRDKDLVERPDGSIELLGHTPFESFDYFWRRLKDPEWDLMEDLLGPGPTHATHQEEDK